MPPKIAEYLCCYYWCCPLMMIWLACEKAGVCKDPQVPSTAPVAPKKADPALIAAFNAGADALEADARANNRAFDRAAYLEACMAHADLRY